LGNDGGWAQYQYFRFCGKSGELPFFGRSPGPVYEILEFRNPFGRSGISEPRDELARTRFVELKIVKHSEEEFFLEMVAGAQVEIRNELGAVGNRMEMQNLSDGPNDGVHPKRVKEKASGRTPS
jgi:hypothetical protein